MFPTILRGPGPAPVRPCTGPCQPSGPWPGRGQPILALGPRFSGPACGQSRCSRTLENPLKCLIPKPPNFMIFIHIKSSGFYPFFGSILSASSLLSALWIRPHKFAFFFPSRFMGHLSEPLSLYILCICVV